MLLNVADKIKKILSVIKNKGYEAYVVGGYVRDSLLNLTSYDVDITTSATPSELKKIFENYCIEDTYSDLGSIRFRVDEYDFEITTFRKEFNYLNHRKPHKVEFISNLKEDLKRRDFTINALCCDGERVIDAFGGLNDLENNTIKTIGKPALRFEEDALRILRAFRFSAKLGFSIDKEVEEAIINSYQYLSSISFDKKYKELKGILNGNNYLTVLGKYRDIFIKVFMLSDLKIELFKNKMSYEEKEALFFCYSDTKINNKFLIDKDIDFVNDKIDIKKKLIKFGKERVYNILLFKSSILGVNKVEFQLLKEILNNKECYNLRMLNISGEDLLKINIKNNKIGKHLNMLLEAVIEDKCINERKALLDYLKNNILD